MSQLLRYHDGNCSIRDSRDIGALFFTDARVSNKDTGFFVYESILTRKLANMTNGMLVNLSSAINSRSYDNSFFYERNENGNFRYYRETI